MNYMLNMGKMVEIIDRGEIYSTYSDWATQYNFSEFIPTVIPEKTDRFGIIKVVAQHDIDNDEILYGIITTGGKAIIIGSSGVKILSYIIQE